MTNHLLGESTEPFTAARVKAIREDAGMTQEEAAAFLHVSTCTWQSWELGHNPMTIATLEYWHLKVKARLGNRVQISPRCCKCGTTERLAVEPAFFGKRTRHRCDAEGCRKDKQP